MKPVDKRGAMLRRLGVVALGLVWVVIGLATWGIGVDRYTPAWTVDMISSWFVVGGLCAVIFGAARPTSDLLAITSNVFASAACAARVVVMPWWYVDGPRGGWVVILTTGVYGALGVLAFTYWRRAMRPVQAHERGYRDRMAELRAA